MAFGFQISKGEDYCNGFKSAVGAGGEPDIVSADLSPRELATEALDYPEGEAIDAPGLEVLKLLFSGITQDLKHRQPEARALALCRRVIALGIATNALPMTEREAGEATACSRQAVCQLADKTAERIGIHRQRRRQRWSNGKSRSRRRRRKD